MTYFKGKCGEDLVKDHEYVISTKDGKLLDDPFNWSLVVKKGRVLVMSMIMMKLAQDEGRNQVQTNTCPNCNETDLGVMADERWLHW